MLSARHFGIDKKEGLLKTFMSNDWMHGVLVNPQVDDKVKAIASIILGSEVLLSSAALMYYQSRNNSSCTIFAMYTLFYSVMCLSNATKN
jgi:hypothetical protein